MLLRSARIRPNLRVVCSRLPAGYAFLEFRTHEAADMLLKSYNGQPIPGTDQVGAGPVEPSLRAFWGPASAALPRSVVRPLTNAWCTTAVPQHALLPVLQVFRLNWAAYGVGKAQPAGEGAARSLDAWPWPLMAACRLFAACVQCQPATDICRSRTRACIGR